MWIHFYSSTSAMTHPSKPFLFSCLMMIFISQCFPAKEQQFLFESYCTLGTSLGPFPVDGKSSSGILLMNSPNPKASSYDPGLNCSVVLQAESGFQLFLTFSSISLRNSTLDTLTVINYSQNASILSGQQECTDENCTSLKFDSGRGNPSITLGFQSANISVPDDRTGFAAVFTVFDYANPLTGDCNNEDLFTCRNKHCIWHGLVCDGHNNCGDRSDELSCGGNITKTIWGIVVVVIGVAAMLIFVPAFCFMALRGTRNQVASITVPALPTPLYPTLNDGETANLLTSSEPPVCFDSEEMPHNSKHSINYGALPCNEKPSSSKGEERAFKSYFSGNT